VTADFSGTYGDSDVGLRQSGCVVDAVADHRHELALLLERLDVLGLVLREDLGEYAIDANGLPMTALRPWPDTFANPST
jgi:hypothetical protein